MIESRKDNRALEDVDRSAKIELISAPAQVAQVIDIISKQEMESNDTVYNLSHQYNEVDFKLDDLANKVFDLNRHLRALIKNQPIIEERHRRKAEELVTHIENIRNRMRKLIASSDTNNNQTGSDGDLLGYTKWGVAIYDLPKTDQVTKSDSYIEAMRLIRDSKQS